jgi:hypothetical protein
MKLRASQSIQHQPPALYLLLLLLHGHHPLLLLLGTCHCWTARCYQCSQPPQPSLAVHCITMTTPVHHRLHHSLPFHQLLLPRSRRQW